MNTRFTSRPFEDERDVARMRDLLFRAKQVQPDKLHWFSSDFWWGYFLSTISSDARELYRLWERDGELVAFALFDPRDKSFDMPMHPSVASDLLRSEMLAWVMTRFNAVRTGSDSLITGSSNDSVAGQEAFLARKGFVRGKHFYVCHARPLDGNIPTSVVPDGFVVRCVAGADDISSRAAAHRSAFHPSRVTDQQYARLMALPGYDRTLDMTAVAPDGTIASFALVWLDERNKEGEFEPVGTHADFQRRGLSKAVLLEGLRQMRARGMSVATVMSNGGDESAGAQALYASVGFEPVRRIYDFIFAS